MRDYAIFALDPEGYIMSWNPGAERKRAEEELTLEIHTPDGPLYLETDTGKVQQILLNLLSNAIKFTDGVYPEKEARLRCGSPRREPTTISA